MRLRRWIGALVLTSSVGLVPSAPPAGADEPVRAELVGGAPAAPAEWPFVVALIDPAAPDDFQGQFCAGSLVRPDWVLTAAHCATRAGTQVLSGRSDLAAPGGERRRVAQVVAHPRAATDVLAADLALLRLDAPVSAPPIPLMAPGREPAWPGPAAIAGWGAVTPDGRGFPTELHAAGLPVLADAACRALTLAYLPGSHLCAGDRGLDACRGDSGGPLVARDLDGRLALAGVTSRGSTAGCGLLPGTYTRVTGFSTWIASVIGPTDAGTPRSGSSDGATSASVRRLYAAYFLRPADDGGLAHWVAQVRAGLPLAGVSDAFAASAEFRARYGALSDDAFVGLVYANVLGRAPDAGGLAHWVGVLRSGAASRGTVMLGFSESAEFRVVSAIS